MKTLLILLACSIPFYGCVSAPDFERDNVNDRNAGIPRILDLRYTVDNAGLIMNWRDGSIQNDLFIVEQIIYDYSGGAVDSLVKTSELEADQTFFFDPSKEFGYPYTILIKSRILNGTKIQAEEIDTLNIEFSKLTYRSKSQSEDTFYINWQNIPNIYYADSVMVEKFEDSNWQIIDFIAPRAQSFEYPVSQLTGGDRFRISATVLNYNNRLSRTSSFEVEVD